MRWKWTDCAVGIVLLLVLGTFAAAQVVDAMETANRVMCASNLRQIGQALSFYANENRGVYPRTLWNVKDPTPTWGTPYEAKPKVRAEADPAKVDPFDPQKSAVCPSPNDITAALFLLLRTQDIPTDAFVCPSTGQLPFEYESYEIPRFSPEELKDPFNKKRYENALAAAKSATPQHWTNWPGKKGLARHLSYSYQNPYATEAAIAKGFRLNNTLGESFAVAADMNPGVDALLKLTPNSAPVDLRKGNSPNHAGDGQNILFGDGHVTWQDNPLAGENRDNVFTFGDSGEAANDKGGEGIVGASVSPKDSILLPTAKDLGVVDADGKLSESARLQREGIYADMTPGTPQEQDAIRRRLMGIYNRTLAGKNSSIQVTEKQFISFLGRASVPYDYKITGISENRARLELEVPGITKAFVLVMIEQGDIYVRGSAPVRGRWTKQR